MSKSTKKGRHSSKKTEKVPEQAAESQVNEETSLLRQRLQVNDDLFKCMLDLIPTQYYFNNDMKKKLTEKKVASIQKKLSGNSLAYIYINLKF